VAEIKPQEIFGESWLPKGVFKEKLRQKLLLLHPTPPVKSIVESMPKSVIGIHVRMTDHLPCQLLTPKWCYRQVVQEARDNGIVSPLLICSDTPEFFEELQRVSGASLVRLTSPFTTQRVNRASGASIQFALADLLLLSKCDAILASNFSSFARLAHLIGDNRFFVLSGLPNVLRSKQGYFGWWLDRYIRLNRESGRWVFRKNQNRLCACVALLFAKILTSNLYQNCPLPTLRTRNRRYLQSVFGWLDSHRS
jgi:hypothetical protein